MSIGKVAALAGVSPTTVGRVINNERNVSPETVLKIRKIMREVGYVPKPPALRRGRKRVEDTPLKHGVVALLVHGKDLPIVMSSPIAGLVFHGVESALAERGLSMVQGSLSADRTLLPPMVTKGQVDGVVVWPHLNGLPDEIVEALRPYPVVYLMSGQEERLPGDRVRANNFRIGQMASQYLISKQHHSIAYLAPATFQINLWDRARGFHAFAQQAGAMAQDVYLDFLGGDDLLDLGTQGDEIIEQNLIELFQSQQKPTGLFVTCDALTAKMYPILKKMGIHLGSDVEVVSCNHEISLLAGLDPLPASIDIRGESIGRRAVEQLIWRTKNPATDGFTVIEIEPQLA
ncbi:TPA: hypothetical protein DDW35_09240 [Candidatus Sumerlaeota bacterium]|nr:hypothetical protein [Candidatus Sumerlaeota bacterium]